jgi:molecular chaperone DnaK (HSP70)
LSDTVLRFLEPALALDATEAFGDISAPSNIDQVITDYLTGLFGHVMKTIESQLGSGVVARVALHVVLTVPAIWSDLAKQRTNQAFHNIPNLPSSLTTSLVSEPEAAAISALRELDGNSFQKAESFVVVDAGGGTVDLITYTIRSLYPILEVDEATEGTGACCGSSLVNLRFKRFLTAKLGNEPNWDKEVLCEALDRFEETVSKNSKDITSISILDIPPKGEILTSTKTKRSISLAGVAHGEAYNISVSGLALNHGLGVTRNGRFSLRAVDLHMLFEPCILRIIQLVKEQITICHDPVRCILLVGGFGGSTYLRERLIQAIEEDETIRKPLEILQPPTAWLAVARGAAMKGIALVKPENHDLPVVMSRAARKHYGYELGVEYDPEIHASLDDQKYWCGYSGVWRVRVVSWFIKRVIRRIPTL